MYTKSVYTTQLRSKIDPEFAEVWTFLSDLFDRAEVVPFQGLQALVSMTSERRTTENKTDCYKFINVGENRVKCQIVFLV